MLNKEFQLSTDIKIALIEESINHEHCKLTNQERSNSKYYLIHTQFKNSAIIKLLAIRKIQFDTQSIMFTVMTLVLFSKEKCNIK